MFHDTAGRRRTRRRQPSPSATIADANARPPCSPGTGYQMRTRLLTEMVVNCAQLLSDRLIRGDERSRGWRGYWCMG